MAKHTINPQCVKALEALLAHFGTKAEMARQAKMSRNAVSYWFARGKVGRTAAIRFSRMKSIPFTKEELRPDIKNWTPVAERKHRKKHCTTP